MTPDELASVAINALLSGGDLTLSLPRKEKWPQGWPRGDLLSVTPECKNYSFDPLKVLGFMQKLAKLNRATGE